MPALLSDFKSTAGSSTRLKKLQKETRFQHLTIEDRFYVVTGGPGSGKSSLIDALERAGYSRTIEAGRAIIQEQMSIGGHALPWDDRMLFAEMMLDWEMRSYHDAQQQKGIVFFDRGVPDVSGYLRLIGEPLPEHMRKACEVLRYNRRVFVAPPWKEIFRQDRERKQDFDEAVRTCDALVATYQSCGYDLVELPRASIDARAKFVIEQLMPGTGA
jgi:predicted ATPase